jgi:uncharacterized membrane protein
MIPSAKDSFTSNYSLYTIIAYLVGCVITHCILTRYGMIGLFGIKTMMGLTLNGIANLLGQMQGSVARQYDNKHAERNKRVHPTQKPVELMSWAFVNA